MLLPISAQAPRRPSQRPAPWIACSSREPSQELFAPPPHAEIRSVEEPRPLDEPRLVELDPDAEPLPPPDEPALAQLLPVRDIQAFPLEPFARLATEAPREVPPEAAIPASAPRAEPPVAAVLAPSRSAEPLRIEPPAYPGPSRRRGEQGAVLLELSLDASGVVADVRVARSSGFAGLDRAAVGAARKWVFEPALERGIPVASRLLHRVVFRLRPR